MMRSLAHIFARVFNVPLLVQPARAEAFVAGLRTVATSRGRIKANGNGDDEDEDDYPEPPEAMFNGNDETWDREPRSYAISSGGVAWLPVRDLLVRRAGQIDADSTELESYSHIGLVLRLCVADARVQGILLDIDSCGGESGGLFDLCNDIRAAATVKPIWAIGNEDCLSAAYAIASATGRIWITRTGAVGGIGVIALHCDETGFDAAEGIRYEYVYAGEHKIDNNPHEPLSQGARESLQDEVDRLYGMFVGQVAAYRGMSPASVAATEAAVFYGEEAVSAGLADAVGTFGEAVAAMSAMLGDNTMEPEDIQSLAALHVEAITQPPEPSAEVPNVVRLDAVRRATNTVRAEATEIIDLCAVAGLPQLAGDFITKETPVSAVRAELLRRKAAADAASQVTTIDTTVTKATPAAVSEMQQVFNERWAAQMGRRK
jgi:ClpP class serine protease